MISGDSTANHMGTVKNIEKARERRTLETMPGSSEAGVPEDLLQQTETIHPRMGYDMSDSIFMQEQQAADRSKEAKKALEERTALEAFRAATLHAQAKPISVGLSYPSAKDPGPVLGEGKRKSESGSQLPIAGIKLRKKNSASGRVGSEGSGRAGGPGAKGQGQGSAVSGADAAAGAGASAPLVTQRGLVRDISASAAGGKKHSSSKKYKTKRASADDADDGDVARAGASTVGVSTSLSRNDSGAKAGGDEVGEVGKGGESILMSGGDASGGGGKAAGAPGLVAYSSDEDDDGESEST